MRHIESHTINPLPEIGYQYNHITQISQYKNENDIHVDLQVRTVRRERKEGLSSSASRSLLLSSAPQA